MKKSITNSYNNIISLGFFCSVAQELEKIGLRSFSSPFDWIITTDFKKILELIDNKFEGFLTDLYYFDTTNQVNNDKYNISFYHDFDRNKTIHEQLEMVSKKYNRRINAFYNAINEKTLFVRYIYDYDEAVWISNNIEYIYDFIKSYNLNNNIVFVSHLALNDLKISYFRCDIDKDDIVGRRFIQKNSEIRHYFKKCVSISFKNKKKNLLFYKKKQFKKLFLKIINKLKRMV